MPRLLTPADVAERLAISRRHAVDLMKAGRLGAIVYLPKLGGRQQVRIAEETVATFIAAGGARPPLAPEATAPPSRVLKGYYGPRIRKAPSGQPGGQG